MEIIMKTLLVSILLLCGLTAVAQNTNITVTFRTEISNAGTNSVTNTVSLKFSGDGSNKDKAIIKGTVWQWSQYVQSGMVTNSLADWLKDSVKRDLTVHANNYATVVNADRAKKLSELLTTQSDALNAGDLSDLDAIIAKWTAP